MRRIAMATLLVLMVASCGGGEITLTEYAHQVEGLTTTMYQRLDELTIDESSRVPTVAEIQATYHGLSTAYHELFVGLQAIKAPGEVADLHATSLGIIGRLYDTQEAFARRVDEVESFEELDILLTSPEGLAVTAAQLEVIAFCQAAQARFDATAERKALVDVPWIPTELHEVVLVVFGCDADQGGPGS